MIVGFQAYGTLGRRLVNREEEVRIHGDTYQVRSQIHTVGGLSAHADQNDRLHWVKGFKSRPTVCVVHGEEDTKTEFANLLNDRLHLQTRVPEPGDVIDITEFKG